MVKGIKGENLIYYVKSFSHLGIMINLNANLLFENCTLIKAHLFEYYCQWRAKTLISSNSTKYSLSVE